MGIHKRLIHQDEIYADLKRRGKKIHLLNNYDYYRDEEEIRKLLSLKFSGSEFSYITSCQCGNLVGRFRIGEQCENCGTEVEKIFGNYDSDIWIKKLDGSEPFINPDFYASVLYQTETKTDIFRWVADSSYNPGFEVEQRILEEIKNIPGFERSFNFLVRNIDKILIAIMNLLDVTTNKYRNLVDLLELYRNNRDVIFSNFIAIPSKKFITEEAVGEARFAQTGFTTVFTSVDSFLINKDKTSPVNISRTMVRINSTMANMALSNLYNIIGKKRGLTRKHIMAARTEFVMRTVCVPLLTKDHRYDDIHLPYSLTIVLLKPHILNKLRKRGYTYTESIGKFFRSINTFDQEIYDIMNEIKRENNGYLNLMVSRNPGLTRSSILRCKCTHIKSDVNDKTMNISGLIIKLPNGDFDGDQLHVKLVLDNYIFDLVEPLSPHYNLHGPRKAYEISGLMTLTDPVNVNISNMIYVKRRQEIGSRDSKA